MLSLLHIFFRVFFFTQKPPRLPVTETGAVQYCLIKLYSLCISTSRNYLRGFLIAACAAEGDGWKYVHFCHSYSTDVFPIIISCPFRSYAPLQRDCSCMYWHPQPKPCNSTISISFQCFLGFSAWLPTSCAHPTQNFPREKGQRIPIFSPAEFFLLPTQLHTALVLPLSNDYFFYMFAHQVNRKLS